MSVCLGALDLGNGVEVRDVPLGPTESLDILTLCKRTQYTKLDGGWQVARARGAPAQAHQQKAARAIREVRAIPSGPLWPGLKR